MNNKPYVIGVAGGSGSGKTFFLNCFLNNFTPEEVCLVSQDDYYFRVSHLSKEENKLYNFDLPSCIDIENFEKDIDSLMNFKTIHKQEYNFNNEVSESKLLEIKAAPILIIEGLFIYHYPNINPLFDYKIFIDAATEIALERRLGRDLIERGYSEEDVMYKWDNHVLPAYKEFLLPHREKCDKIIDNSTNDLRNILDITDDISNLLREKTKI